MKNVFPTASKSIENRSKIGLGTVFVLKSLLKSFLNRFGTACFVSWFFACLASHPDSQWQHLSFNHMFVGRGRMAGVVLSKRALEAVWASTFDPKPVQPMFQPIRTRFGTDWARFWNILETFWSTPSQHFFWCFHKPLLVLKILPHWQTIFSFWLLFGSF